VGLICLSILVLDRTLSDAYVGRDLAGTRIFSAGKLALPRDPPSLVAQARKGEYGFPDSSQTWRRFNSAEKKELSFGNAVEG
jgi:hypothetical protein